MPHLFQDLKQYLSFCHAQPNISSGNESLDNHVSFGQYGVSVFYGFDAKRVQEFFKFPRCSVEQAQTFSEIISRIEASSAGDVVLLDVKEYDQIFFLDRKSVEEIAELVTKQAIHLIVLIPRQANKLGKKLKFDTTSMCISFLAQSQVVLDFTKQGTETYEVLIEKSRLPRKGKFNLYSLNFKHGDFKCPALDEIYQLQPKSVMLFMSGHSKHDAQNIFLGSRAVVSSIILRPMTVNGPVFVLGVDKYEMISLSSSMSGVSQESVFKKSFLPEELTAYEKYLSLPIKVNEDELNMVNWHDFSFRLQGIPRASQLILYVKASINFEDNLAGLQNLIALIKDYDHTALICLETSNGEIINLMDYVDKEIDLSLREECFYQTLPRPENKLILCANNSAGAFKQIGVIVDPDSLQVKGYFNKKT